MYSKIVFLTKLIPTEDYLFFRQITKKTMQDAASALEWNIINGFVSNGETNIEIINCLPVDSYPQYCTKMFINRTHLNSEEVKGINVGFCNVKFIRNWFITKSVQKALKQTCDDQTLIILYTMSTTFLQAISKVREIYPNIKVCCIIADLPSMSDLSANKSLIKRLFEKRNASLALKLKSLIDYYVLLTQQMSNYLKIEKPYVILEGIAGKREHQELELDNERPYILYTGTLHKRFGVQQLVNAFSNIKTKDVNLIICGAGDSENRIIEVQKTDSRIKFMGQLPRQDILALQEKAIFLVNPRRNDEEFTKYSFPSKTMEYLSSGRPVVAYKLDGIPNEYDEYLNYPIDDSEESLTRIMEEMLSKSKDELSEIGEKGKRFVETEKNAKAQTFKIIEMLRRR